MKIIIANEYPDIKEGEVLISPLNGGNIFSLDNVANSECSSIKCYLVDKIPLIVINPTIQGYVSKLRHGGRLSLIGTDLNQVCISIINRYSNIMDANRQLFGGPESYNLNSGMYCISDISAILQGAGLEITKKSLDNNQYLVEAVRH